VLVPVGYLILEDLRALASSALGEDDGAASEKEAGPSQASLPVPAPPAPPLA